MAHANVGQSVHHGIGDGYWGCQRGQFPIPFAPIGVRGTAFRVSRAKVGVVLALGKVQSNNVPVNGWPSGL
jgi:hypothetical protein